MDDFPSQCYHALTQQQPYPQLSSTQPEADLSQAYALQKAFVALRDEASVGYKAALTAAPAQQAMGLSEAIVGVLLASTPKNAQSEIQVKPGGILETELGFELGQNVTQAVTPDTVLDLVKTVSPMVEIAHPNIAGRPTGSDLVATNSATFGYLRGAALTPTDLSLDEIGAELQGEKATLFAGRCGEVMGGQLHALCWLMNMVLELGYPLRAGHLLMTGSVGGVAPVKSGRYQAVFSAAGEKIDQIEFSLLVE